MSLPKIRLYLLGGTITMEKGPSSGAGVVPTVDAATLCRAVPGLDKVAQVEARTDQMLASSNLTYAHGLKLAADIRHAAETGEADGFVVVQGTDTLEEMAFLLDCLLDLETPVVVTGAMRSPAQLSADGPANLMAAVICAATKSVGLAGVIVAFNDEIHSARFVTKGHTGDVGAFQSLNTGPLGRVVEGKARLLTVPVSGPKLTLPKELHLPNIPLLRATYGDQGFLLSLISPETCDGLVIEGFGAGHVPEKYLDDLDCLVKKIPVVLSSRIAAGHVLRETYGFVGSEIDLIRRGLIPSGILDGLKAKILLTLLVMSGASHEDIRQAFDGWNL